MGKWEQKKAVVTGGCGFIGSHLVRKLLSEGVRSVVVVDSLRYGDLNNLPELSDPRAKLIRFNLGFGRSEELERAFEGADYLFHLAAEKHNQSKDEPEKVLTANINGTQYLYEMALKSGVKKIVFTSSLYAYGKMKGDDFRESDTARPETVYGVSKLAGEGLLWTAIKGTQTLGNVIRYFFVYGPRQFAGMGYKSVILKNFERLRSGESPVIFGDGNQTLDYIFVDDAVEATMRSMLSTSSGEVFNVGSGKGTSINLLTEKMIQVSGMKVKPTGGPVDWTQGTRRVGDIEKIKNQLQWAPSVNLEEGLRRTWDWMKGL